MSETILQEAQRLVYGDRMDDYGDAGVEANRIVAGWSVILGHDVQPEAYALCMAWVKIVRQLNRPKRDNIVDLAGYAGLVEKIQTALKDGSGTIRDGAGESGGTRLASDGGGLSRATPPPVPPAFSVLDPKADPPVNERAIADSEGDSMPLAVCSVGDTVQVRPPRIDREHTHGARAGHVGHVREINADYVVVDIPGAARPVTPDGLWRFLPDEIEVLT